MDVKVIIDRKETSMSATSFAESSAIRTRSLKATTWLGNVLLFGIPALGMCVSYYFISPMLAKFMPLGEARMIAGSLVMIGMLIAAMAGLANEGHPFTWTGVAQRFRLTRLDKRTWAWAVGGLIVYVLLAVLANVFVPLIYKAIQFTPPIDTAEPWGLSALPLVLMTLTLNILGEELWWRGYILPRQELQFGKTTWIWHGLMWAFFHAFKWWTIPALLFVCLVVPFVAQRTKNTVPGILSHFVVNGLGVLLAVIQLLAK
jgi:membrane protease YdiL (CAAX protease family)